MTKLAILGTAPTSRDLAPYNDPEWKIWVCSPGNMGLVPRADLWFEIHALEEIKKPEHWRAWGASYFPWLAAQTFPVVMQEHNDLVPKAVVYPIKEMLARYGHNWFTSSVAYMLALAIARKDELGLTDIGIFGVDMAADQEHYTQQKSGCIYFMEMAQKLGIRVHVPHESSLSVPLPLYGYDEATHFGRSLNATLGLVTAKRAEIDQTITRLVHERDFFDGALEQLRFFRRTWVDGAEAPLQLDKLGAAVEARVSAVVLPPPATLSTVLSGETPVEASAMSTSTHAEVIQIREAG